MTFLEILQRTAQLAGMAVPTTTLGQSGEVARLLVYIAQAYNEIQTQPYKFRFMWARGEFETTASTKDYDPSTTPIDEVDPDSWTIFKTSDGESTEVELDFMRWVDFRANYGVGTVTAGDPSVVTIMPNKNIRLYPTPDDAFKVQFDYYRTVDTLSGDTDEPILPSKYHDLIVYDAVTKYGKYEESQIVMVTNAADYEALRNDMLWTEIVEEEFPAVCVV